MNMFFYKLRNRFIKPYDTGYLPEKDGHTIFYQQIGNPNGEVVLSFHGGPGGSSKSRHASAYNLKRQRIILFDQRGCGESLFKDLLLKNTPQETVNDAIRLLDYLKVKGKVTSAGFSYGSTCALLFAQMHPERVKNILVGSIFLAREQDYENSTPISEYFYPDVLDKIQEIAGKESPEAYFQKLLFSNNEKDIQKAMKYYGFLEHMAGSASLNTNFPQEPFSEKKIKSFRIYLNYQINHFFLKPDQILQDCKKIKDIPARIYQNRLDFCCPPKQAFSLHKALPKSKLTIIADKGHGSDKMFYTIFCDNNKN